MNKNLRFSNSYKDKIINIFTWKQGCYTIHAYVPLEASETAFLLFILLL